MNSHPGDNGAGPQHEPVGREGLVLLACVALASGLLAGLVGAVFRITLAYGDNAREAVIAWARQWPAFGWLVPVLGAAAMVAAARWLVRRYAPLASGSGVQQVEAVMDGAAAQAPVAVIPVKFIGGTLAISSGLALGREGPTVQMAATIGSTLARKFALADADVRAVQSAAAGAGLAVAFNAPLGGAVFVFEELARKFTLRLAIATLAACAGAVHILRLVLGDPIEFVAGNLREVPFWSFLIYLTFGAVLGVLGVAYNRATIYGLDLFARITAVPVELRAALVGAAVGLVAWFEPRMVGGGEQSLQQLLNGQFTLFGLALIFAVRWVLGPLSYSVGAPGGLFSPLLFVGAAFGGLFGGVAHELLPSLTHEPAAFAIVGMAAFFTAVVRAPLTGMLLIVELTATTALMVPLLAACAGAMLVPALLGNPPIYDTLRARILRA